MAVALADCILYQVAAGGAAPGLALRWLVGAVTPWAAAFVILRAWLQAGDGAPSWQEAALIAIALGVSSILDAILIPPEALGELDDRLAGRLPLALAIPLAARLRLHLPSRARPTPDPRLVEARLLRAAGNYVEVRGPRGSHLLRMTLAQAEAELDPARHVRIHRSIIVAAAEVARLERDRSGIVAVRLLDGSRLPVGRRHRARVKAAVRD